MLPTNGRVVIRGFVFDGDAMLAQGGDGAFQVHSVPEHDGSSDQVESACAITLVLEAAIAQIALPLEKDGCGKVSPMTFFIAIRFCK